MRATNVASLLDADAFLRAAYFGKDGVAIESFCHQPLVVRDAETKLAEVLPRLRIDRAASGDDVIDEDLILT